MLATEWAGNQAAVQTRGKIVAALRSAAAENGGKPIGRARFTERTGITEYAITQHWPRYSGAVREAGIEPNTLNTAIDDAEVVRHLVDLTQTLGRVPTANDLRHARATDRAFPSRGVFDRLGTRRDRMARGLAYCGTRDDRAQVAAILADTYAAESACRGEAPTGGAAADPRFGFVHHARGHPGEYEIGRANLVDRRLTEIGVRQRLNRSWSTRSSQTTCRASGACDTAERVPADDPRLRRAMASHDRATV